ncbi:MAG: M48 family metallopeptidase [Lentisphaerae bacterium]|nr:M48 family metallopeptidase [Lentisphaerota bacterium]
MTRWKQTWRLLRPAVLGLTVVVLAACATVPVTGRREFLLIGSQEEMQLGLTEFQKMKKATPVSHDKALTAMVEGVGRRIAAVVPLPNAQWEFVLFDDPKQANAFCLPGGKVGVYTGILPITKDEVGLATVIGHEVSHAVARHGAERMSQGLLVQFGGAMLGQAMQKNSARTRALALQSYGLTSTLGVMLPHSRTQETEADHLGLVYMARAGYDPSGAIEFWKRFSAFNNTHGGQPPQFLSTHPVDRTRIANLERELPAALVEYHKTTGK